MNKRVLVTDDSESVRNYICELLKRDGYDCEQASSGEEAIRMCSRAQYAIVIMDMILPGMDGAETCKSIKETEGYADVPVLFVTNCKDTACIQQVYESGGSDYIPKPFSDEELCYRARHHAELYNAKQLLTQELKKRKRAEAELRENEKRSTQLLDKLNSGVAIYQPVDGGDDFIILRFNRAAEELDGVKNEEIRGRRLTEIFPGAEHNSLFRLFKQVYISGKPLSYPVNVFDDGKKTVWRENYVYTLPGGELVSVFTDRTEEQQAKSALKETEKMFQATFQQSAVGMSFMSLSGHYLRTNDAYCHMLGYGPGELQGKHYSELSHPDSTEGDSKVESRLMKQEKTQITHEKKYVRKDGSSLWLHLTIAMIYENEQPSFILVVYEDINQRKQMEEALKENQEYFRQLAENIEDVFWLEEPDRFIYISKAFEEVFCMPRMQINESKEKLYKHICEGDKDRIKQIMADKYSNKHSYTEEFRLTCPGGQEKHIRLKLFPIHDGGERYAGLASDITEEKQVEQRILEASLNAEQNERRRYAEELHDGLGPLLSSARMYIRALVDEEPDKQKELGKKATEIIDLSINSAREISNNLSPHMLSEHGLVRAVRSFTKSILQNSGQKIDINSNMEKERLDELTERTLYRLAEELIHNGVKHSDAEKIRLGIDKKGQQVFMRYADNGKGIDNAILESEERSTHGLNNLIIRSKRLGGSIDFDSQPGKGLKVEIRLPLKEQK